jgi:hypothetical protein
LAKTHSRLSFDELCEEALGEVGLHPWEFYEYDFTEYLQKRKGLHRRRKDDYQQMLIASMLPYMKKEERVRIVNDAFKKGGAKVLSLRERYNELQKKYQPLLTETVKRKPKAVAKDGQ